MNTIFRLSLHNSLHYRASLTPKINYKRFNSGDFGPLHPQLKRFTQALVTAWVRLEAPPSLTSAEEQLEHLLSVTLKAAPDRRK